LVHLQADPIHGSRHITPTLCNPDTSSAKRPPGLAIRKRKLGIPYRPLLAGFDTGYAPTMRDGPVKYRNDNRIFGPPSGIQIEFSGIRYSNNRMEMGLFVPITGFETRLSGFD
jgi:hypothetical protein